MPIQIENMEGNRVDISEKDLQSLSGNVTFSGRDGFIRIGENCRSVNLQINVGNNCSIDIGNNCNLSAIKIYTLRNSNVKIGNWNGFTFSTILQCHEPFDINIGDYCLFASETRITVSDMHSVIDKDTGELQNPGGSVEIGSRVWLASEVMVMKGVTIGSGSIIGARSLVTKDLPQDCLAAGIPAKVIRSGVTWNFDSPFDYKNTEK